jgi:hypothetical protein
MIYITGDCHSDFTRFNEDKFPIQEEMTKDDYVIICGDFGGVWTFEEEMKNGIKNLEKVNYKVDYIISHCCPTNIQVLLGGGTYKNDYLTEYLQEISEKCEFKKWYFGHYHDYRQVNSQFTLLYKNIVPVEFNSIFE